MDLIRLSINRPIFIFMLASFFIVLGVIALMKLPVDLYPNVSYPVLVVRADLPGAAPEEVEQLITKRMEDTLSTLPGLSTLRSMTKTGTAMVMMEFDMGTDVRFQEVQVRGKIGNLRRSLPDAMNEPAIYRQDPDDTPIIEISITGEKSASEISKLADKEIANKLRQIDGVGQVDLSGTREEEILVELKPEALDAWHINAKEVVTAISQFNRNDSAGNLKGTDRIWMLRSISEAKNVIDIGAIPIARTEQGIPIFLRDIAEIHDDFTEISRVVMFGDKNSLKSAVRLSVLKQSGENTVSISDKVQKALKEIKKSPPSDIDITITRDNAELIRSNVADVYESLYLGAILTILVVLVFLRSPRSTMTTGLSLPSSIITTFAIMGVAGFTVNVMTLLSLSLAIGLLVDDAIVVRENIFRHMHKSQISPIDASYNGAKEVSLAVISTTLTIVAVFLPVGFMGGVSGQFFKQFALTVVFAVLISLWDAMTMAPMLSSYFANIPDTATEWLSLGKIGTFIHSKLEIFDEKFDSLANGYDRILGYLLPRPWAAASILAGAILVAAGGFVLVSKSFLPAQLGNVFGASLNGPIAIPIERVADRAKELEKRFKGIKELDNWTVSAGVGHTSNASIDFTVRISPEYAYNQDILGKIRQDVRKILSGVPGYTTRISEPADPLAGSSGRYQPLAVNIFGDDIAELRNIGRKIRETMVNTPGVTDVAPIQDEGLPEILFKVKPELVAHFGSNSSQIADTLMTWVDGNTSNNIQRGDDQVPIRVRMKNGRTAEPSELLAYNVYTKPNGSKKTLSLPMGNMVDMDVSAGPTIISRENRQRVIRIGGNLAKGAALGDVVTTLQKKLDDIPLPKGYRTKIVGQNEQMNELFGNVIFALILGSIFIYMILASLFESLLHPISVMIAIPLAATGAVIALIATGKPIDLYSGIGMILLAGIVAKNSILLVDFAIQKVRDQGMDPASAIRESAPIRLRPILMTSVAVIFGMIPVAAGIGSGGAARQSLGIATIGGVISSTFLTLFVVPSLYIAIESFSKKAIRFRKEYLKF